jgi:uncharacterized membrane protein
MHFHLAITIDRPREEVWRAFDNRDNLKKWQTSLATLQPLSGTPGQVGATARLVYEEGGHRLELQEAVTARSEPEEFAAEYDGAHARNTLVHRFTPLDGDHTRWDIAAAFHFKGAAKFLAPMYRGRIEQRLRDEGERFKSLLEAGELSV